MTYLAAHRYGLTRIEPSETLRQAGWRQVWEHPSGLLAMRHPATGRWIVSDGSQASDGFCSSLRAAANKIARQVGYTSEPVEASTDTVAEVSDRG